MRGRAYFYLGEVFLLGAGAVIGDFVGWVMMGAAVVFGITTAILTGDLLTVFPFNGRMPMSKASALMFSRATPETKKLVAGNSTIEVYKRPENYFALALLGRGRKREIEIWGKRSKLLKMEKLEPTDLALGLVIDGDLLVSSTSQSQAPTWIDLKVRRKDALTTLKQYEDSIRR